MEFFLFDHFQLRLQYHAGVRWIVTNSYITWQSGNSSNLVHFILESAFNSSRGSCQETTVFNRGIMQKWAPSPNNQARIERIKGTKQGHQKPKLFVAPSKCRAVGKAKSRQGIVPKGNAVRFVRRRQGHAVALGHVFLEPYFQQSVRTSN